MFTIKDSAICKNAIERMAEHGTINPEAAKYFDVGSKEYLEYFRREVIEDFISQGGATCKFFEGAYGSGKSHTLSLLKELALEEGMVVCWTDLSQSLNLTDWKGITEHILQKMQVRIDGEIVTSLPEIIAKKADSRGMDNKIDELSKSNVSCPGFRNAICYAANYNNLTDYQRIEINNFLMGYKVSVTRFKHIGISRVKGNLTKRNAEAVLRTVLFSLYALGFTGVALFFDENEKQLESNSERASEKNKSAANLIRRLIDGCTNGVLTGAFVSFAVLPGFLDNCSRLYQALGQRIQVGAWQRDEDVASWRWPVLQVDSISRIDEREKFVQQAAEKFADIVKKLGGDTNELIAELCLDGNNVLEQTAGSGYKRAVMKTMAYKSDLRL